MTLRLAPISPAALIALRDGDVLAAERLLGLSVPEEFAAQTDIWTYMLFLLDRHPDNERWLMQAVVDDGAIVGNAGFKGAPADGTVELGYRISTDHRRRGLALAAVRTLLDRGAAEPCVDTVVATIDPANDASIGVVTRAGFAPAGDRIHPRWGRQLVFAHDLAHRDPVAD